MSSDRTLITVAPTGAETAKSDAPGLPVTLDELVGAAEACERAGAGLVHVHIRDGQAQPTLDLAVGTRNIVIRHADFPERRATMEIKRDQTAEITLPLGSNAESQKPAMPKLAPVVSLQPRATSARARTPAGARRN